MNKTTKRIIIAGVVVVIALLIVIPRLDFLKADSKSPDKATAQNGTSAPGAAGAGGGMSVDVLVVKSDTLNNTISSTGTILANEEVEIRSEVSGKITKIYFDEGDYVKKGTTLIRINADELQARLTRLDYNVKLAKEQEYRQRRLLDKEAISQQEYDIVLTQLNSIKAEAQELRAVIDKYTIRAPFNGVIGLRSVSEGSYLSPTTLIASMQDIDRIKVDFTVSEQYAEAVDEGDKIAFRVNGRDREFAGTVYAVEPKIDLATRSLRVRAVSPNPERELVPGAFARVELTLETVNKAVLVPTEALVPELNQQKVFMYRNGVAHSVPVEIGVRTAREVQITKGIEAQDSIIVTGLLQLKDSTKVRVREMKTSETYKPLAQR